jgi:hypothetical protein
MTVIQPGEWAFFLGRRFGFALKAVYIDAMDEARKHKPQIPLTGNEDIPIAHEFEFETRL